MDIVGMWSSVCGERESKDDVDMMGVMNLRQGKQKPWEVLGLLPKKLTTMERKYVEHKLIK